MVMMSRLYHARLKANSLNSVTHVTLDQALTAIEQACPTT